MDPHANLERQRQIAREISERGNRLESRETGKGVTWSLADLADELAELVLALDEWRAKGGFDPYEPREEVQNLQRVLSAEGEWTDDTPERVAFATAIIEEIADDELPKLEQEARDGTD